MSLAGNARSSTGTSWEWLAKARRLPRVASIALVAAVAVDVLAGGAAPADAQILPGAPIGPPYLVDISHEGQVAIAAGYTAAPGAIVCMVTTGVACAVTPAIVAVVTPIVTRAIACPDGGTRRIEIQDRLVPPRPGAIQSVLVQFVESNTCIAAP